MDKMNKTGGGVGCVGVVGMRFVGEEGGKEQLGTNHDQFNAIEGSIIGRWKNWQESDWCGLAAGQAAAWSVGAFAGAVRAVIRPTVCMAFGLERRIRLQVL